MSSLKGTAWDWRELRPIRRCDGGLRRRYHVVRFVLSFFKLTFHGGGGVDNVFEISVSISFFWVPEEEGVHCSTISVSICFVFRRCHHFIFFSFLFYSGFLLCFALSFLFFSAALSHFYYYDAMGLGLDWVGRKGGYLPFFSLLFCFYIIACFVAIFSLFMMLMLGFFFFFFSFLGAY